MARKPVDDSGTEVTMAEGNDAEDPRTFEHDSAEAVRNGEISAAQLPGGHGNVDPQEPDAQYPPGVVDNSPVYPGSDNPEQFVPERRQKAGPTFQNTSATPDYGTNSEE